MPSPRQAKLSDRIKEIVAAMLERRVKDPRLGYTVMGDEKAREDTAAALVSATGLIRSEVGKQLSVRHTPSLEFFLDAVPETAREIEDLLAKARERDARVAEQAQGAQYAGDADPYKKHEDDDEETGDDD